MKKGERATIREIVNKTAYHYESCIEFGFTEEQALELARGFQKSLLEGKTMIGEEETA